MVSVEEYTLVCFEELDSTNVYALKNILELSDRTVVSAATQTNGVGRLNREWFSSKEGNIYLSIVLKPQMELRDIPLSSLTQYMSVVLCQLLQKYSVHAEIKWPNDTLVNGKKIAGILSQTSIIGEKLQGYVLGIGINLNLEFDDLTHISQPATSLNLLTGTNIDSSTFRKELLDSFFYGYEEFLNNGFSGIMEEYVRRCTFLGKSIKVNINGKTSSGIASEITNDGALVLFNNNESFKITMGEMICS
jgi:BirA family biotin operon repressor/biotin-[acetyl-CoA-carboxylase] ligase